MHAPRCCVSAPVRRALGILLLVLAGAGQAHADAIVRSQAMRASTIAEIFVVEGALTVELEIGVDDLEAFRKEQGRVFAQHEYGCMVYGMPKAVIEQGLANRVLPLGRIGPAITRHVERSRTN